MYPVEKRCYWQKWLPLILQLVFPDVIVQLQLAYFFFDPLVTARQEEQDSREQHSTW